MFTLQQMKAAHAKVKSGADFPAYVQEIKQLGLLHYEFIVKNGQTLYHGQGFQLSGEPVYPDKNIATVASPAALRRLISETQQGKSDFPTFCSGAAVAGVEKWVVDTQAMLCTYYDMAGNVLVAEPIPDSKY